MPTAILAVAGTIGAATLGFIGVTAAVTSTLAIVVGAALVIGTTALATKAMRAKAMRAQAAGAIQGTLVTKSGSSVSIPVVYGLRRIGGHRSFIGSNGATNVNLHVVESLCEGPVEACEAIYFNDELVATCSTPGSTSNGDWSWLNHESGTSS